MSKASNRRRWVWQRISYWGDKLLTLIFYLFVGLFIISYKLTRWGSTKSINLLKRFYGAIQTYRDAKRHKRDWQIYGLKPNKIILDDKVEEEK